jgi:AbrB family looped-hinge helix DNA binding protein
MESVKASSKGQMVIPKAVREALDIRNGTELGIELLPGKAFKVTVKPTDHAEQVRRLAGCFARYATSRGSARGDDKAILQAVAEDDTRSRSYGKRARRKRP